MSVSYIKDIESIKLEGEVWTTVNGSSDYQVSNLGRVVSFRCGRPKLLKASSVCKKGYRRLQVINDQGESKKLLLHRLVALNFIPNPDNLPEVNHKNGDKDNACVTNLEWVTSEQNVQHATETGLVKRGEESGSKVSEHEVKEIMGLAQAGYSVATIYKNLQFKDKITYGAVLAIVRGYVWSHFTGFNENTFHNKFVNEHVDISTGEIFKMFDYMQLSGKRAKTVQKYFKITPNKVNCLRQSKVMISAWESLRGETANFKLEYN